jgi:hypothetical protein
MGGRRLPRSNQLALDTLLHSFQTIDSTLEHLFSKPLGPIKFRRTLSQKSKSFRLHWTSIYYDPNHPSATPVTPLLDREAQTFSAKLSVLAWDWARF